MPKLLIASTNPGKTIEFRELLAGCGWEIVSPADIGLELEVEETGTTYAENARLKAEAFCAASGLPSLADDSGLEVDALNGEPGALHHLHGWDGANNDERIDILLRAMKDVPEEQRTARFRSYMLLVTSAGERLETEGTREGVITMQRVGDGGFGYDPVFYIPKLGRTMAQLTREEKNRISHRGLAAALMKERLMRLAETS
ncbi:MAG TPA: RdgB/HAM1 family non-canonical purine NTP pyrophosphatase [Dehalococcoidia bacterium]|nr:RdgB/HAM1 family non-canonical purine NTP pyrophosphatase [Dehalococcoidia bacterium]